MNYSTREANEHINFLLDANADLVIRVERLESIILSLTNGMCSTYPDAGPVHTHQVYLTKRVTALMEELAQEHKTDEDNVRCPRCGKWYWARCDMQHLCPECESGLAEEQASLADFGDLKEIEGDDPEELSP